MSKAFEISESGFESGIELDVPGGIYQIEVASDTQRLTRKIIVK